MAVNEEQCEQLIDYFNGQLSKKEQEEFEQHLEACAACKEELEEWKSLSEELPFLSEPVDPPAGMRDRVLGTVLAEESVNEPSQPVSIEKRPEKKPENNSKKRRMIRAPWIAGTAAAALLISLIGNGYLLNERQDLAEEAERLEQETEQLTFERDLLESDYQALLEEEQQEENGVADVLLASNLATADEDLFDGQGSATIITENGETELVIQVTNMEQLEGTEAYQAWIIEGEVPVSAGSFTIDENGNGAVSFQLSELADMQIDQIAVSLEPQPNSVQPEGQIVLASQ